MSSIRKVSKYPCVARVAAGHAFLEVDRWSGGSGAFGYTYRRSVFGTYRVPGMHSLRGILRRTGLHVPCG
eukprot:1353554-Prymnesium_polylepis.2